MSRAHRFDVIVVGAGGAGLMAARYAAQHPGVSVAVISKLYPTRSHTGAAQGGVGAALGNVTEDHAEWHAFRSEEHTSELQSRGHLVCRLLLEKKREAKAHVST